MELSRKPGLWTRLDPRASPAQPGAGPRTRVPGAALSPPEPPRGRSRGGFPTSISRVAGRMGFVRRWKLHREAAISPPPARLPDSLSFLPPRLLSAPPPPPVPSTLLRVN